MSLSIFKIIFVVVVLSFSTAATSQASTEDMLVYKARDKADPTSMSTTESIIIHDLATGVQHTVVTYTNSIESGMGYADVPLVVSPDGGFVFNIGSGTQIWDKGQIVELLDGYNYQWSAHGQLAFIGYSDNQYDIYLWQEGELTSLGIPDTHPEIGALAAFDRAADGRFLFYGWGSRTIYVWDDGDLITIISPDLIEVEEYEQILDARWSADGRIAFIAGQNQSPTWNLYLWADNTVTRLDSAFTPVSWSVDGRIAYVKHPDLYVWEDGTAQRITEGFNPRWSTDGQLAFTSENGDTVYVWDGSTVAEAGAGTLFSLPAWSTDGRLVFSDYDLYIWDHGTVTRITDTPDLDEINPQWITFEEN